MKPQQFLFWIISGAVLLVLLITGLVVTPSVTVGPNEMTPEEVKDALDSDTRKLAELHKKIEKTPDRVFDPQDPKDYAALLGDYLLTSKWPDTIDPNVDEYGRQLGLLREDLVRRSEPLRKEVSASHDRLPWYSDYRNVSGALVVKMRDAGALEVPATATTGAPRFGAPAAATEPLDPLSGLRVRDILGLLTTETPPEQDEHPLWTARLRVTEAVCNAVLASAIETAENPIAAATAVPAEPAAIAGWEWKQESSERLDPPVGQWATHQVCSITLRGTESQMLSALARIESIESPVVVVLGGALARGGDRAAAASGIQPGAPEATLTFDLLVLDFSGMTTLAATK